MAKYESIIDWKDLEDNDKIYRLGKPFPKPANKNIPKERLEELLSDKNKLGQPVIKIVEEKETKTDKE